MGYLRQKNVQFGQDKGLDDMNIIKKRNYYEWHKDETAFMDIIYPFLDQEIVLDIGCGTGWIGKRLKSICKKTIVIGLDVDLNALKIASYSEEVVSGDALKLPFNNETFDGIIAKDVIEHLINPFAAMMEFNRVLKTNGALYVSVPDVMCKTFWDDYSHIRPYNKKSLSHLAEDTGFIIDRIWYSASWPGLGIIMKTLRLINIPKVITCMAGLGIRRQNIIALLRKNTA